jgi:hypothetical protein
MHISFSSRSYFIFFKTKETCLQSKPSKYIDRKGKYKERGGANNLTLKKGKKKNLTEPEIGHSQTISTKII